MSKSFVMVVVVVAAVLAFLQARNRSVPTPAVFAAVSLADAKARIAGTERLLVVKATASWCGPCKQMDRLVFSQPSVETWVAAHGLAVALDVDREPADARALQIEAVPTIVVFGSDGAEVARSPGVQDPERFIAWLDQVRAAAREAKNGGGAS
jgi:thiol:disulfide interchange protein